MHITSAIGQTVLDAAQGKERVFQIARNSRKSALAAQKAAKADAQAFALQARDALRPYLGRSWSVAWTQAGYKNNSLALPDSLPQLVELVGSLETYFTAHPTHANAALSVTAVIAGQRRAALETAITAVNNSKTAQRTTRDERDAAEDALVEKLRASRNELEVVLTPEDPRWLDFIEDVPADEQRPEAVDEVEFDLTTPRHIKGSWGPPSRSDRFLIRVKVAGVDTDFRHVKTVSEPEFDLNTFATGAHVQVQVVAANGAGESAPSPVAEIVVG